MRTLQMQPMEIVLPLSDYFLSLILQMLKIVTSFPLRTHLIICLLLAVACTFYLTSIPTVKDCYIHEHKEVSSPADESFFLARSFPDAFLDLNAYESAIKLAKNQMDNQLYRDRHAGLLWETQGPTNLGARINAIAVHPFNENIIYLGFSRGGIFKTTDGGQSWIPVFDNQPYLSIGTIKIDPSDPNIIYVGTGDPNIGYYSSVGDGVWKSTNGGLSWSYIGLKDQRIISKIEIDPSNNKIIYAAAMGLPYQKNKERGLYKSIDGGSTWTQKLFVSDSTGICDFEINPVNPQIIYASSWDRIRSNKTNIGAGNSSGIFRSLDGGSNWTRLEKGLPSGKLSRVGITICKTQPNILYSVFVSADDFNHEGIYKTSDSGNNWERLPDDENATGLSAQALGGFGWYFSGIDVNPNDPNDVFLLGVDLWRTKNAGNTWTMATPGWASYDVHADKHDIQRTASGKLFLATDGGAYKSTDDGTSWTDIEDIPATQFYRVAWNSNESDKYYGGAQDNGTTSGNISVKEWPRLIGGDGFQTRFDKKRPSVRFYELQYGDVYYFSDKSQYVEVAGEEMRNDRVHWDAPYDLSKHEDTIIYYATNRLWRGVYNPDSGVFSAKWSPIGSDFTNNDRSPAPNNTITCFDESPLQKGLLYVGTGDANVWRIDVYGKKNEKISLGLPQRYVTSVKASAENLNRVFVTLSGYREFESTPHVWRSDNGGSTWQAISGDLPPLAVNDIFVLPNNRDSVLFAATDGGVYYSKNSGKNWLRLGTNMPLIPVFDFDYNDKMNQLVAATYARSIMTFDLKNIGVDSSPLVNVVNFAPNDDFRVFPTAFTQSFTITTENSEISEVKIYDLAGRLTLQSNNLQSPHQVNADMLQKGIYILQVRTTDNRTYVRRIYKN